MMPPFHKAGVAGSASHISVGPTSLAGLLIGSPRSAAARTSRSPEISYDDATPAVLRPIRRSRSRSWRCRSCCRCRASSSRMPGGKPPPEARRSDSSASTRPMPRPGCSRCATAIINAVQVYPFSSGALYQVYAAPGQVTDVALAARRAARRLRPRRRRRHRALDHRRHRERDRRRPSASTSWSSRPGPISRPTSSSTPTGAPIFSSCARPRRPIWPRCPGSIRKTSSSRCVARTPRR